MNPFLRVLAALTSLATACAFAADQPPSSTTGEIITAKWQAVDLKFTYTPTTTYYSCDSLEWKLDRLFKSIGAHPKSKVVATGCDSSGPARFAFLQFIGAVPVPATSAASPNEQQSASKQALLKRLGVPEQFERTEFPARRSEVDLARLDASILEAGDCELLEQLGGEVLPKLGTTQVRDKPRCFPGNVPLSTPSLKLDVLMPAPSADAAQPEGRKPR